MPIFDFKCPKCDNKIEMLCGRDFIETCPKCKIPMEKQMPAPSFKFSKKVTKIRK